MSISCAVRGCDGTVKAKGMCHAHYCRVRKNGDPGEGVIARRRRAPTGRLPNYRREYTLRSRYGVTLDRYKAMFAAQGDACAICGATESGDKYGSFHLDHDHASGSPRGVLCAACNKGIGHLGDDPDRLMAAAAYLLQHADVLEEVSL